MKILFLVSGFNGLSQRIHRELTLMGHDVSVEVTCDPNVMIEAVSLFEPNLIVCPFLKSRIPETIWKKNICLIVHPGIEGDQGPSSLDWAISSNAKTWGVTLLQACEQMDAGDIWGTSEFKLRNASKANIYRREITQQAVELIKQAIENVNNKNFKPKPLDHSNPDVKGSLNAAMKQNDRQINWQQDSSETICQKINAADSHPGVLDNILGVPAYLYGIRKDSNLSGQAGEIIAYCDDGICKASKDGAVWIRMAKLLHGNKNKCIKLPATQVLNIIIKDHSINARIPYIKSLSCNDIDWEIHNEVAYLYFDFYNGAMNTQQCQRLKDVFQSLKKRSIKVIVLMGGESFWGNGIQLNCIESSPKPDDESWRNIQAINNLIEEIIQSPKHITIAALRNNAGAGGAIMPLACDKVIIRDGIVLNPHYATMGLYGSEYWTYLLPKRVGTQVAQSIMRNCMPLLAAEAHQQGISDILYPESWVQYHTDLKRYAESLTPSKVFKEFLKEKRSQRQADEKIKRLQNYRKEELSKMRLSFFDPTSEYHSARRNFVYKVSQDATPDRIAKHRQFNARIAIAN